MNAITNKMSCKFGNSKTFSGHDVKTCLSMLQKCIMDGDLDKGLYFLTQINLFAKIENGIWSDCLAAVDQVADKNVITRAKAIRTNLVNILLFMMVGDIGIANFKLPEYAKNWHIRWQKHRKDEEGDRLLVEFFATLVNSKKSRLLRDLKIRHGLLPFDIMDIDQRNDVFAKLYKKLDMCESNVEWTDELFVEYLESGNVVCLEYVAKLLENDRVAFLTSILDVKKDPVVDSLLYFYKKLSRNKESILFLYQALVIVLYRDKLDNDYTIENIDAFDKYKNVETSCIEDGFVIDDVEYVQEYCVYEDDISGKSGEVYREFMTMLHGLPLVRVAKRKSSQPLSTNKKLKVQSVTLQAYENIRWTDDVATEPIYTPTDTQYY